MDGKRKERPYSNLPPVKGGLNALRGRFASALGASGRTEPRMEQNGCSMGKIVDKDYEGLTLSSTRGRCVADCKRD